MQGTFRTLLVGVFMAIAVATPASAAPFITADGCPHHQAFVEGDEAAVSEWLPDAYEPVRTASGAPLLFFRAISCEDVEVAGKAGPGVMATYGVVIESPDGLGCTSSVPGAGAIAGELLPICNWYIAGWLADDPRVAAWLRRGTPGVPAAHVPGLKFELGSHDPALGGAPFRFETSTAAPSPFIIEAVGRERPGDLRPRGGYWVDTPEGTVKFAFATDDLTSGDANGTVTAAAGSLMARLMGAGQRSYAQGFSALSAERWQRASYRKQQLADAPGADRFSGSCDFEGVVEFTPPATNAEARDLVYDWEGTGTCSGELNGRKVEAAADAHQTGPAHATCSQARTTRPGTGAIKFAGGETVHYTLDFSSVGTEVDLMFYGERSGFARAHASFLTDRTSPDVFRQCRTEEGVRSTPLDLTLTTESPLVSQPRLTVRAVPRQVRSGRRHAFRFRVTTAQGQPVAGALVRFSGRRTRADSTGRARITAKLARAGRFRVQVSKPGYRGASTTVIARRGH
jgi:hypothetical protein